MAWQEGICRDIPRKVPIMELDDGREVIRASLYLLFSLEVTEDVKVLPLRGK